KGAPATSIGKIRYPTRYRSPDLGQPDFRAEASATDNGIALLLRRGMLRWSSNSPQEPYYSRDPSRERKSRKRDEVEGVPKSCRFRSWSRWQGDSRGLVG